MTTLDCKQDIDKSTYLGFTAAPGSREGELLTAGLERHFRKIYTAIEADSSISLQALGIRVDEGPLLAGEEELMATHYDAPDCLFDSFLDHDYRAYSMAYFGDDAEGAAAATYSLEEAQTAKFALICERAGIEDGDTILNIGCGFGSFENYVLKHFPRATITGVTASQVQADYIRERCTRPGDLLADGRFRLVQDNLNRLDIDALGRGHYDRVISIAVLEQMRNIKGLCALIDALLKPGGTSFHHFITSRKPVPQFFDARQTRIGLYFPGGIVWSEDALAAHCTPLQIKAQWFVNGMNYRRTLDAWHQRFWAAREQLLDTCLDRDQFKYWNEYFYLCKAMFSPLEGRFYGNSHYLLAKSG